MIEAKLDHVRHYLPAQGPIKDFIHHNTLHAFQDETFEDALSLASECYDTHCYMPLGYYRQAFEQKRIDENEIEKAIRRRTERLHIDARVLRLALHEWMEVSDEKSLEFLIQKHGLGDLRRATFQSGSIKETAFPKIRHGCFDQLGMDWDAQINPIFFRVISAFLDQGITLWQFPRRDETFWEALKQLVEQSAFGLAAFVRKKRMLAWLEKPARDVALSLLSQIAGDERLHETYIRETLMVHPGWSGMVSVIETKPSSLLRARRISLMECLAFKLILEWEFIQTHCVDFVSLSTWHNDHQSALKDPNTEKDILSSIWFNLTHQSCQLSKPLELNALLAIWHEAFERSCYRKILSALQSHKVQGANHDVSKNMQVVFCIDDRECSFRRHLEEIDPSIQTFGWAGFFGMDFFFQSLNDAVPVQMCPPIVTPRYIVKESPQKGQEKEFIRQKARTQKNALSLELWREASGSLFLGFLAANTLGHITLFRLIASLLQPKRLLDSLRSRRISIPTDVSVLRSDENIANGECFVGFTHEEMIHRVENVLRGMGLTRDFAQVVIVLAHGSSSVNNPHFAAYDCGACSGKPGAPNARVIAHMANLPKVREGLAKRGIVIASDTVFVGGYHDTATDLVSVFDIDSLSSAQKEKIRLFLGYCTQARLRNAQERCRRFAVTDLNIRADEAVSEVMHRTLALFEPRPELGHATNVTCIVGRRELTKGLFLDRRAFLNSYDPTQDEDGRILAQILNAAIPVCGGINLEYYFSRVDPARYGCGTKLSHNVVGLLGVCNGIDDDLRTGLPLQMTEVHDPIRLLMVIEQTPELIERVLRSHANLMQWVNNSWIRLVSMHPVNGEIQEYTSDYGFVVTDDLDSHLPTFTSSRDCYAGSRENIDFARIKVAQ